MVTAALLKPNQKLLDAIKAYTDQILLEPYSSEKLKATLLKDYVTSNKITIGTLQQATGFSAVDINNYLAKAFTDNEKGIFDNREYKLSDFEKLKRQISIQKEKLKLVYSGGASQEFIINDMAAYLASYGLSSVLDLAGSFTKTVVPEGVIVQPMGENFVHIEGYEQDAEAGTQFIVTAQHKIDKSKVKQTAEGFVTSEAITVTNDEPDYFYNKVTGKRLPVSRNGGSEFWGTNVGSGITQYHVKFADTGLPVFYTVAQKTGFMADYGDILQMAALVAAVIGVPAILGEYIIGTEAALANPALSQTIGKVSLNTVLSGGDLSGSLTKAVMGVPGAYVGDIVGTGLDSDQIGKVAEAATTAKLTGSNINQAVLFSLTSQGIKKMDEYDFGDLPLDYGNDPFGDLSIEDLTLLDLGIDFDAQALADAMDANEFDLEQLGIDIDSAVPDLSGNIFSPDGVLISPTDLSYADDYYAASDGTIKDVFNRTVISSDDAANLNSNQIADKLYDDFEKSQGKTVTAEAGDKLRPSGKALVSGSGKVPSITDQASVYDKLLKTAVSIGASVKAISNGTFRIQNPSMYNPYGTARPQAVGVPIRQADGSTVTNNGNGTQTIRRIDGTTQTIASSYQPMGNLLGGISTQTILLGGAVLLGAFLLVRRK
jgi:hypothetical protein